MPPIPIETKHHPSSVDLLLIKRLITDTSKKTLLQFLQNEFVNINKNLAARLIGKYDTDLVFYISLKLSNISRRNTFDIPFTWPMERSDITCPDGLDRLLYCALSSFFQGKWDPISALAWLSKL